MRARKWSKILYLAATSRLLEKPISIAVKGPSSGGKSYLVERVLGYFPESAYYALTAMSEGALAYSEEPIKNRFLIIYEAAGLSGDFQTYLIRSLLSEGRLRYEVVEKTSEGLRPRLIEREGPTGLIVTTTAVRLHPENETRLLSLNVTDTQEQTRSILAALARETAKKPDLEQWHARQEWLEGAEHRVTIPYAETLAGMVPPVGIGAVLLIAIGTALATSFDGPKDDGKLRANLQEDTANSNEETREENRTTSEEETTAGTSDKTKNGSRKADKAARKSTKAQNAGNKGDREVARAGKGGSTQRASGGQSARAARGQGSGNYEAGSSATPAPASGQAVGEGSSNPTSREADQYVTGESPANTDPNASTSQDQYAPSPEGTPATPDPSAPTSPEENAPEPNNTEDSTETSPDTPASSKVVTPSIVEDLPPSEGSDLELDSPGG